MTLQNLLGVSLAVITPDRATVARLLVAAARNITDAKLAALSAENRFDAGDPVPDSGVTECVSAAMQLDRDINAWLSAHHSTLLASPK